MTTQKLCVGGFLVALCFSMAISAMAQPAPTPVARTWTLSAGSMIAVVLQDEISTQTSRPGQAVSAMLIQDMYVDDTRVLPAGTRVFGSVSRVDSPFPGRNAILKIDFDSLVPPQRNRVTLSSYTDTGNEDHTFGGELTPGTRPEIIPYRVYRIGTYGRVMYNGPRAMGEHIRLKPGDRLVLVLQQPLVLSEK